MSGALLIQDTMPAALLRHRLALGVAWVDAISQTGARGPLSTILDQIGAYRLALPFERHRSDRFALRYAGAIQKRIDKAIAEGDPTDWQVHVHAPAQMDSAPYDPAQDARTYVPRRLQMAPLFPGAEPVPVNIRTPWLWPGSAYPFPATATLIRGSVRRGLDPASAVPLRWARVFATTPAAETDFALATVVGCGHGDDRGEYVLALGARAVSGATLVNPLQVRLWAFAPPPAVPDPADSLLGMPLENGGGAVLNDILRGTSVPPGYTAQQSKVIALRLGETRGQPESAFLFGP